MRCALARPIEPAFDAAFLPALQLCRTTGSAFQTTLSPTERRYDRFASHSLRVATRRAEGRRALRGSLTGTSSRYRSHKSMHGQPPYAPSVMLLYTQILRCGQAARGEEARKCTASFDFDSHISRPPSPRVWYGVIPLEGNDRAATGRDDSPLWVRRRQCCSTI